MFERIVFKFWTRDEKIDYTVKLTGYYTYPEILNFAKIERFKIHIKYKYEKEDILGYADAIPVEGGSTVTFYGIGLDFDK